MTMVLQKRAKSRCAERSGIRTSVEDNQRVSWIVNGVLAYEVL